MPVNVLDFMFVSLVAAANRGSGAAVESQELETGPIGNRTVRKRALNHASGRAAETGSLEAANIIEPGTGKVKLLQILALRHGFRMVLEPWESGTKMIPQH